MNPSISLTHLQVKASATLIAQAPTCYTAILYCRLQDMDGSGWATIKASEMAKACGRDVVTVLSWLRECEKRGWLYSRTRKGQGIYRISYASINKIAISLGCDGKGTAFFVSEKHLPHLKDYAVEATLEGGQIQSLHRAMKEDGKDRDNVLDAWRIFENHTSEYWRGDKSVIHVSQTKAFVGPGLICFGGTQAFAARKLGVSERTVQRRVSTSRRDVVSRKAEALDRKPLLDFSKWQVIRRVKNAPRALWQQVKADQQVGMNGKLFLLGGQLWEAKPNIYKSTLEVCKYRLARRVKRYLSNQLETCNPSN